MRCHVPALGGVKREISPKTLGSGGKIPQGARLRRGWEEKRRAEDVVQPGGDKEDVG